jgi:hypothetical protein
LRHAYALRRLDFYITRLLFGRCPCKKKIVEQSWWSTAAASSPLRPLPITATRWPPGFPDALRRTAKRFLDAYRSQLRPFESEYEVAPGVVVRRTGGHTPGHSVVRLASGGDRLTFAGDAVRGSKDRRSSVGSPYGGKIITGQFWTFATISAHGRREVMSAIAESLAG